MTSQEQTLQALTETGVIAVIRADKAGDLVNVGRALRQGGVKFIEITMTVPGALAVIERATAALSTDDVYIGAGTVLDAETARLAMLALANYIVSPVFRPDVVSVCRRYAVPVMPGAMTPTEGLNPWEAGADVVKIFSAGVAGPQFFKDLGGPFPHIKIMPTGAVNRATAPEFIKAGACAVGVGGELVGKPLIAAKDFAAITKNALDFIAIVQEAKRKQQ
jgi:2-dehydro-3-deoxyphosphogluconate aldolase / (4S)-4-hydroxy-2-oxoglutarate aldolase